MRRWSPRPRSRGFQEEAADVVEGIDDVGGVGEGFRGEGMGDGDDGDAAGGGSGDAGGGVFDDTAAGRRCAQQFGGAQEDVRGRFGVGDVGHADGYREEAVEAPHGQDFIDDRMGRTGGDGEGVMGGEAFDEFGESLEDGLAGDQQIQEALAFEVDQCFEGVGGLMPRDEVVPEGFVGAAVVVGEVDAVGIGVTEIAEDIAEGPFMEGFAIDDDAVQVEDDSQCGAGEWGRLDWWGLHGR